MKVAIYCRVSTQEQKKYGISIDEQKDSLTKYCKEHKLSIYDYYIDEGISAGSISKRKELVRLLGDLDNFDMILFTKLDRFSRNVRDANNMLEELNKHNVSFKAIYDNLIDTSTADGKFTFNLLVSLGERERQLDGERINKNFKYKYDVSKTVCSGAKIYGYDIIDKKYVVNEQEQKEIIELYNHFRDCGNLRQTLLWYRENYKNVCHTILRKYLTDTKYIGQFKKYRTNIIIEGYIPRLMDDKLFYEVQNKIKRNIKEYSTPNTYIFSGLLWCNECHHKIMWRTREKKSGKYKFCICRQHNLERTCTMNKNYSEKYIEDYLIDNILNLMADRELKIEELNKHTKKNKSSEIKAKMNKLTDIYMQNLIDIDKYKKDYKELVEKYEEELEKEKINKTKTSGVNLEMFKDKKFIDLYFTFTEKEKQKFWFKIIDKIEVGIDGVVNVDFL